MCEDSSTIFVLVMLTISFFAGFLILRYLDGGEKPELSYMRQPKDKSPFHQHLQ